MFSVVIISSSSKSWETDQIMRFPKYRFTDCNGQEAEGISCDDPASLRKLEQSWALLMYERGGKDPHSDVVRVGRITDVRPSGDQVAFAFTEEGRLTRAIIEEYGQRLGINDWEHNRNHWSIKDGGIPNALLDQMTPPPEGIGAPTKSLSHLVRARDLPAVEAEITRALDSVENDPAAALTAACALIEAVLKTYIDDEGLELPSSETIKPLWGVVSKHLSLDPGSLQDEDMRRICSGLSSIIDGVGAFRTHAGSAHGRGRTADKIGGRHARLAIHAAHTLATFIIESWNADKVP